jgi:predicted site-specific integrase-resolvase
MLTREKIQSLIISREEAAELLGVTWSKLWIWYKRGLLKPLLANGRCAAYLRSDVEEFKQTEAYRNRFKREQLGGKGMFV